ncbi:MAG: transporter substrate-binding domain-containing protein [Phormidesmis sp.]
MTRRWFLIGLALPLVGAGGMALAEKVKGNKAIDQATDEGIEGIDSADSGDPIRSARNRKTLVMATAANYPPYEQLASDTNSRDLESRDPEDRAIVGFDIDLAKLIAERLNRELSIVDLEFDAIMPAVVNNEVDMAIAAIEPTRPRKQQVDFSDIYYRARHALISIDGYLRSPDLSYQTIGVVAGSVQARYVNHLLEEAPNLNVVPYDSLEEIFAALDIGEVEGAIVEGNTATTYLGRHPDFQAQMMPNDQPTGSAIALPKKSPLRRDINAALADIKATGEMDRLIALWFG